MDIVKVKAIAEDWGMSLPKEGECLIPVGPLAEVAEIFQIKVHLPIGASQRYRSWIAWKIVCATYPELADTIDSGFVDEQDELFISLLKE